MIYSVVHMHDCTDHRLFPIILPVLNGMGSHQSAVSILSDMTSSCESKFEKDPSCCIENDS